MLFRYIEEFDGFYEVVSECFREMFCGWLGVDVLSICNDVYSKV